MDQNLNFDLDNPKNMVGVYWGENRSVKGMNMIYEGLPIYVWVDGNGNKLEVKAYYKIYGRHSPAPPEIRMAYAEVACKPEAEKLIYGWNNPPEGASPFHYALHKVEFSRSINEDSNTNSPPGHGTNWEGWGDGFCFVYYTKAPK